MFVQSKASTQFGQKNGVAIRQRRNKKETLVQWSSGENRWILTEDLQGEVKLLEASYGVEYND